MNGPIVRRHALIIAIVCGAMSVSACAGPVPGPTDPNAPQASVAAASSVEIPPDAIVVELAISAEGRGHAPFRLDGESVDRIEVTAGRPYVFRVRNPDRFDHNFWIGGAHDLAAREYDRLTGVHVWNDGIREVVYSFTADGPPLQFACTLAGHYGVMHADIDVVP
jgi:uncharacterized cupredoxin-like copper-binding protein